MKKVPFRKQVRPVDHLQAAEWILEKGEKPSNEQLAKAIEHAGDRPLPRLMKAHLARHLRGKIARRTGRKPISEAKLAVAMEEVNELYQTIHAEFVSQRRQQKASARPRGGPSPSEYTYREVLKRMKRDFPNLDWRSLRNMHSKWRRGALVKLHPDPDDGDEFI